MIKATENVVWVKIPFADVYTSVFLVRTPDGAVLFDTACNEKHVQNYIVPFLKENGVDAPKYVFISHNHGDHSGGLASVMELFPSVQVVTSNAELLKTYGQRAMCPNDGQLLFDVLQVVAIPGHTADAMALLDTRTGTLLSGDCLQAYGLYGRGPWGSAIRHVGDHFDALDKLRKLDIQTIITAHNYHPFEAVVEKEQIPAFLNTCRQALGEVRDIIVANENLDDEQLLAICNDRGLPRIGQWVIDGVREAMETGIL